MKAQRTHTTKALLAILPALLLTLILQPTLALATDTHTVTFTILNTGAVKWADADQGVQDMPVRVADGATCTVPSYEILDSDITFRCWTCDKDVQVPSVGYFPAGTPLTTEQVEAISVDTDLHFTLGLYAGDHNDPYTITYVVSDSRTYNDICNITIYENNFETYSTNNHSVSQKPNLDHRVGYMFDYWTANKDIRMTVTDDAGAETDKWISAGTPFKTINLNKTYVTGYTTFTAHFRKPDSLVTYDVDPAVGGTVSVASESPTMDWTGSSDTKFYYGQIYGSTPTASKNYDFLYWTASAQVCNTALHVYPLDYQFSTEELQNGFVYVSQQTTFTAHFKQTAFTVKYLSAGHGTVSPTDETVDEGNSPSAELTVTPEKGYKFSHWTANMDVVLNEPTRNEATTIKKGDPIDDDQRQLINVTKDLELTANFEKDPDYVDPDDSDDSGKLTPANGSGSKLTPKTGDTLPGATAAVVLGAGVLLVVGTKLVRKRCQ